MAHLECHRNAQKPDMDTRAAKLLESWMSVLVQRMTGIKASAQLDCTGREHGVLQLKASGERHDGLCPRCLAEGSRKR